MTQSHGHTPAAWTAVGIMLVGFLISAFALPLALPWMFFLGLGVVAVGAVTGKVLQMMGMGNTVAYKDDRDPEYDGSASRAGQAPHDEQVADPSDDTRPAEASDDEQPAEPARPDGGH